jgi:hypothetical protein
MSSLAKRWIGVVAVTLAFALGIVLFVALFLTKVPQSTAASQTRSGAHLYLATVAAAELRDPHPTWVSYYAVNSHSGDWRHDTTYTVPAHTLVHVTVFQYDGASGLRNPFLGTATGLVGGNFLLNGKSTRAIDPISASHVFAIPQINVNVPLLGVADDAKNQCANAPCSLSNAHTTTTFTFRSPSKGLYRWQCFVPCAAGWIDGFGGPMQTVGYMDGFIKVV